MARRRGAALLALLAAAAAPAAAAGLLGDYKMLTEFGGYNPQNNMQFGTTLSLVVPPGAGAGSALLAVDAHYQTTPAVQIFAAQGSAAVWQLNATFNCCPQAPPVSSNVFALSFAASGTSLLVGMAGSSGGDPTTRGARLYNLVNGTWAAADALDLTCTTDSIEGSTVALSRDGTVAWVGGAGQVCYTVLTDTIPRPKDYVLTSVDNVTALVTSSSGLVSAAGVYSASAYPLGAVYAWTTPNFAPFTATKQVIASPGLPSFGRFVSMSADNSKLAVGVCGFGVYVYAFLGASNQWDDANPSIVREATNSTNFGCPVALSPDGLTLMVGSIGNASPSVGKAYAFVFASGAFAYQQLLVPAPNTDASFGGNGLDVASSGTVLVGGIPGFNPATGGIVAVFDAVPTASATPSATATSSASASSTSSASATATASATASATATTSATASALATRSAIATTTATGTRSLTMTATATSSATATPTASATASATSTATSTNTASATATATSTSTSTTTATPSTTVTATPSASIVPLAANSTTFITTVATASTGGLIALVALSYFLLSWLRRPAAGRVTKPLFAVQVTPQSPWTMLGGSWGRGGGGGSGGGGGGASDWGGARGGGGGTVAAAGGIGSGTDYGSAYNALDSGAPVAAAGSPAAAGGGRHGFVSLL
jgi:hypothetical protein